MTGGTSIPSRSAWPTSSTSTAPARRSSSPSWIASWASTRAAAEHFWPAYRNAEVTSAGTTSSRSASESTITQFLPPISAITRLRWFWPGRGCAASLTISSPTAPEPVQGDRVHARVLDERRADVALAGQQGDGVRRHAGLAQRPEDHQRAAGRLLGRLEHDRVAGRQAGGDHPERDRQREVPRRDDRDDPARAVGHRVALARHLQERGALGDVERAAGVVLEEVDRLADVRVGLRPWLRALAHRQRGRLQPPLAQPPGGPQQRVGALGGGRGGPALRTALRGLQRGVDVLWRRLGRRRHDAVGLAGVG